MTSGKPRAASPTSVLIRRLERLERRVAALESERAEERRATRTIVDALHRMPRTGDKPALDV